MSESIKILGVHSGHNASVAYLENGALVEVVAEERFTGVKNMGGIPIKSIAYIFEKYDLHANDFKKIVMNGKTTGPIFGAPSDGEETEAPKETLITKAIMFGKNVLRLNTSKFFLYLFYRYYYIFQRLAAGKENKFLEKYFNRKVGKDIVRESHHLCHAASAYYGSPFNKEKALVLTLDAEGDYVCSTVNVIENMKIEKLAETKFGHSVAELYMYVTKFLAMKPGEHEYKVMGMAPYSKDYDVNRLYAKIKDYVTLDPKNKMKFKSKFLTYLSYPILLKELRDWRFDIISGAFQKLVEDRVSEWVAECVKATGISTVCVAGGVFMNVKLNMLLRKLPEVERFFVIPSCGDDSGAIGAAYLGHVRAEQAEGATEHSVAPFKNIYLGSESSNNDVETFLREGGYFEKYRITKERDIEKKTAELLANRKIVARHRGRMEFGARALGARSILAHPQDTDLVRVINEQMKNRDFWMPFAGSMLAEDADKYLIEADDYFSPYMMMTYEATEKAKEEMRAAMHPYDFTMRPQMVTKELNPRYHALISEFKRLTGISGVLNTSFNLHGFPIVAYPKDSMHAFENSGLEYVTIEDYLITKEPPESESAASATTAAAPKKTAKKKTTKKRTRRATKKTATKKKTTKKKTTR